MDYWRITSYEIIYNAKISMPIRTVRRVLLHSLLNTVDLFKIRGIWHFQFHLHRFVETKRCFEYRATACSRKASIAFRSV